MFLLKVKVSQINSTLVKVLKYLILNVHFLAVNIRDGSN